MRRLSRLAAAVVLAASLAGCGWDVDWRKTGELWVGALCDGVSKCSYDADGDPYTLH